MHDDGPSATGGQWPLLEAFFLPTLVVTPTCVLLSANEAARELLGALPLVGTSLKSWLAEDLQDAVTRALLVSQPQPRPGPTVHLLGSRRRAATWLSRTADGSHVVCTLLPTADVADETRGPDADWQSGLTAAEVASLFRATPAPVALLDLETRQLLDVSERYCELLGVERAEVVGSLLDEDAGWQTPARVDGFLERIAAHTSVAGIETTLFTRTARKLECVVDAEQLNLGSRRLVVLCLTDVTSKKRAERASALLETQVRQSQKLEALGTLAGGIAHDFNNILGSIVARAALAVADANEPEMVKLHVREINTATDRAKALVRRILTFSRQQAQDRVVVKLEAVLQEALDLVRPTLPSTTAIDLRIDAGVPEVQADTTQIHQAIINLCNNAYQAMPDNAGTISISLHPVTVDQTMVVQVPELRCGNYACLSIADTGCGMPPEILERIFDPFFTTKPPGQGTGLGLAVVHGVVREHEGAIVVDSTPGVGTSFQLYFPQTHQASDNSSDRYVSITPGRDEHVLVVDDEEQLCQSIAALLRKIGYRVTACTDPREALQVLRLAPGEIDVLLTDLTMPKLTGLELYKAAQQLRPDLPVIVTSGYTANWDRGEVQAGTLEFSPKPLGFAELSQSVRRALDNSARRHAGVCREREDGV